MYPRHKNSWFIYKKIPAIICPALNGELIHFTRAGFNHLIRKGRKLREAHEQSERLYLLKHAPNIISSALIFTSHRKLLSDTTGPELQFWTLEHKQNSRTSIVVVIRQTDHAQKHFFSVFKKKHKTSQRRS